MQDTTNTICPGCKHHIPGFPALSRYGYGNLCSDCGTREALEGNFIADARFDSLHEKAINTYLDKTDFDATEWLTPEEAAEYVRLNPVDADAE
jgi:hypothetical protein